MDTWEFNKFAGAALAAMLIAFGSGAMIDIIAPTHAALKPGYDLPFTPQAETGGGSAAQEAFSFAKIAEGMQKGSAENGQAVFKRCATCHTPDKGGRTITGPNLWGVVGHDIAANPTFPRYSAAMKGQKGKWTWDKLATYLHDPRGTVPGNQMAFAGVKNPDELADLLVYLGTLNDTPQAPPQVPQQQGQAQPDQAQPAAKKQ